MPEFKFVINGTTLSCLNDDSLTTGNVGTYKCSFIFADGLQGMKWYAAFKKNGRQHCAEIENGSCEIPQNMLDDSGTLYVGVFASMLNDLSQYKRLSTNFVILKVNCGAYDDFLPGAPSLWERTMMKINAHMENGILNHPDGSVTWDKLDEGVQAAINDKSPAAHTHPTDDILCASEDVVATAYDMCKYMGSWADDGIVIGVCDKESFVKHSKIYMTYGDSVIEAKPSDFTDMNVTAYDFWGNWVEPTEMELQLFAYRDIEFAKNNPKMPLDPIYVPKNKTLSKVLDEKAEKKHTHNAADIYIADGRDLEQKLVDMGADTSELVAAVSELNDTVDEKIDKTAIGTYCKYNLVAGVTSQLYVAVAYPIPGVSKYTLIANGKQMGETTTIGQPLKIASILTTATNVYLCFMDSTGLPIYYAQMNDNIKNNKFTTGILTYFTPSNPWTPGGIDVPVAGEDFE